MRVRRVRRGRFRSADRGLARLDVEGIAASIGTVGDAFDNALMETVNGLFNTECIRTTVFHHGPYRTLADVEFATAGWVDWCNNRRLHGSLGMLTPIESETLHYKALTREPAPTKQRQRTREDSEKPVGARELTTRKESTFDDSQE